MRKILLLFVVSLLTGVVWGQSYTYYCWIDNDPTIVKTGTATGEKQFNVNIASLSAGLHLLHVQAFQNNKGRSSVRTLFFIKQEQTTATTARYWIDNDLNTMHNGVATSGVIDLDIASLKAGLHVVHYQTFNAKGDASAVRTLCFLMTEQSTATTARYWIDNDANTLHEGVATSGIIDLDISKLGVGLHVVHYQTFNAKGDASPVRTKHFFVDQVQIGTLTASIGIDDGEATNYALSEEDIEIDISELADGRHELNVTLIDGNGCPVGQQVNEFIVGDARDVQTLELAAIPEMTYGADAYTLPQMTAEGLDLTWSIDDDAVASINENVLTIVGAGTATITATQEGNDDYQPFSHEFTLTVNKAMLTITANDCTKQEGDANPELTVSYSGFVNNDNATSLTTQPAVTTTATTDSPAGTYPITVSGAESGNYEFTYVSGTLTVTEKPAVIEVTDISQLDNAIYIEPTEVISGTQAVLSVKMKNNAAIQTIQFDLYLPVGVTVVPNEDDELITASKERVRKYNYFQSTMQANGAIRLLAQATTTNVPAGDGEICRVTINVPEDMEEGDYPIVFKDILLVESNNTGHSPNPNIVRSKLTVLSYTPGDANNDGDINAIDFNMIGNHILGHSQTNFNVRAADISGDGSVNAIDFNMVGNYILYGTAAPSRVIRKGKTLDPQ